MDAFSTLAYSYAHAVDRRDYEMLGGLFIKDAELIIPHLDMHYQGREAIVTGIRNIEMYESTYHAVHNQLVDIGEGGNATAETYCTAMHFSTDENGRKLRYDMGIRYLDVLRFDEEEWRFVRRELLLDWENTQTLAP